MSRVSKAQAIQNRRAVVEAASRLFRARGVDGVGVRELMEAAGLTQGALAKQFGSKDTLAGEACAHAFKGAERAFSAAMQGAAEGRKLRLIDYYLGSKPSEHLCPMATLSLDAARAPADSALRASYANGLQHLAAIVAGDPPSSDGLVLLAAMVGASLLAPTGNDTSLAHAIRAAVADFASRNGQRSEGSEDID